MGGVQEKLRASSGTRTGDTSIELRNSIRKKGRTPGEGEGRCQAIVLVLLIGLRCLSGRSRRIRKNPAGVSCRSFRVLALKSTRNRGDVWASLQSPCGLHRSLPGEG